MCKVSKDNILESVKLETAHPKIPVYAGLLSGLLSWLIMAFDGLSWLIKAFLGLPKLMLER